MINITTKDKEESELPKVDLANTWMLPSPWVTKGVIPPTAEPRVCPECQKEDCPYFEAMEPWFECDCCGEIVHRDRNPNEEFDFCGDCEEEISSRGFSAEAFVDGLTDKELAHYKAMEQHLADEDKLGDWACTVCGDSMEVIVLKIKDGIVEVRKLSCPMYHNTITEKYA